MAWRSESFSVPSSYNSGTSYAYNYEHHHVHGYSGIQDQRWHDSHANVWINQGGSRSEAWGGATPNNPSYNYYPTGMQGSWVQQVPQPFYPCPGPEVHSFITGNEDPRQPDQIQPTSELELVIERQRRSFEQVGKDLEKLNALLERITEDNKRESKARKESISRMRKDQTDPSPATLNEEPKFAEKVDEGGNAENPSKLSPFTILPTDEAEVEDASEPLEVSVSLVGSRDQEEQRPTDEEAQQQSCLPTEPVVATKEETLPLVSVQTMPPYIDPFLGQRVDTPRNKISVTPCSDLKLEGERLGPQPNNFGVAAKEEGTGLTIIPAGPTYTDPYLAYMEDSPRVKLFKWFHANCEPRLLRGRTGVWPRFFVGPTKTERRTLRPRDQRLLPPASGTRGGYETLPRAERYFLFGGRCKPDKARPTLDSIADLGVIRLEWHVAWHQAQQWGVHRRALMNEGILPFIAHNSSKDLAQPTMKGAVTRTRPRATKGAKGAALIAKTRLEFQRGHETEWNLTRAKGRRTTYFRHKRSEVLHEFPQVFLLMLFSVLVGLSQMTMEPRRDPRAVPCHWDERGKSCKDLEDKVQLEGAGTDRARPLAEKALASWGLKGTEKLPLGTLRPVSGPDLVASEGADQALEDLGFSKDLGDLGNPAPDEALAENLEGPDIEERALGLPRKQVADAQDPVAHSDEDLGEDLADRASWAREGIGTWQRTSEDVAKEGGRPKPHADKTREWRGPFGAFERDSDGTSGLMLIKVGAQAGARRTSSSWAQQLGKRGYLLGFQGLTKEYAQDIHGGPYLESETLGPKHNAGP